MVLEESITAIKGIGNKTAALLNKLGIYTKRDIIKYFPRNYDKYEKEDILYSIWGNKWKKFFKE